MDEKHRQYCIKLGNPYMREEQYKEQFKTGELNSSWIPEENKETNWLKNNNNNY